MKKCIYNVVLDTELGKRNGTMQLSINGTKIDGFLSFFAGQHRAMSRKHHRYRRPVQLTRKNYYTYKRIVGFVGNKIVDKSSDVIRNKAVRKKNFENPSEPENLADRFEKGRKL